MHGTNKGRKTSSCIVLKTNNKANIEKNIFKIFAFYLASSEIISIFAASNKG